MFKHSQTDEPLHYAAYGRVSTDEQREGESVESQLSRISQWAEMSALEFIHAASFEEDYTGYEWERPEMDIIRDLAKQGRINAVIVTKRDRFARAEDAALILEKMFAKMGVRLFSVQEGEFTPGAKNRILSAVERSQSEDFAETVKENMRTMRYHYIDNGAFPAQGKPKYGYNKTGKKAQAQLVINEEEAEIVRWIFELFTARKTYNEIADILNRAGVARPAIAKGLIRPSKTQGWNRLGVRNLIDDARYYKGEYIPYKRADRKEDHASKQVVINVPAIIDEATYEKVEHIRSTLRRLPIYTDYEPFTLAKRMTCECGYSFAQQKTKRRLSLYRYYRCVSTDERQNRRANHCTIRSLPADKVEAIIWDFIKSLLLDPRTAIARYKQQREQNQRIIDNALAHLETVDELIAELNSEREQVLTLFKKRLIKEDRLEADIGTIDRQLGKLEQERARWSEIITQYDIDFQQLDSLEKVAADLRGKLDEVDNHRILKVFDKLRLKVHAVTEDGQIVLYLSVLGYDAGKAMFSDNGEAAPCYTSIRKPLIFRILLSKTALQLNT